VGLGNICLCEIALVSIALLQQRFSALPLQGEQWCGFWFLGFGFGEGRVKWSVSVMVQELCKTHELFWWGAQTSCLLHCITKRAHRIRSPSRPVLLKWPFVTLECECVKEDYTCQLITKAGRREIRHYLSCGPKWVCNTIPQTSCNLSWKKKGQKKYLTYILTHFVFVRHLSFQLCMNGAEIAQSV
jgi:hypothetical protein